MIEWILLVSALFNFAAIGLLFFLRDLIAFRIKLFTLKKKGVKKIIYFSKDKTMKTFAGTPDKNNSIKIGEYTYTIARDSVLMDRNEGKQAVVIIEGHENTVDPANIKVAGVDPDLQRRIALEAYYLGLHTGRKQEKMMTYLLMATMIAAGAAALLCFLNFQTLTDLNAGVQVIIQNTAILLQPVPIP